MTIILAHSNLTDAILGVFYGTHYELGHGFSEQVCQAAMVIALREAGLAFQTNVPLEVRFRGHQIGFFRADMVVGNVILLEFKAAGRIESWHEAQVLNYLRASELEVGLLLNFGPKAEFRRLVFSNARKRPRGAPEP
jgi:GxxExxY protein